MDSIMQQLLREIPAASAHVSAVIGADFSDGNDPRVPLSCKLPRDIHRMVKLAGRLSDGTPRSVKDLFATNLESSLQKSGYMVSVKYKRRNLEVTAI